MKNLLVVSVLLVIASACQSSKSASATNKMPLMPEIMRGEISRTLYSFDRKDSVDSKLNYAFYSNPKYDWQDTVNASIGYFLWSTSQFEGDPYVYSDLTHRFFGGILDRFEKLYAIDLNDSSYFGIWNYDASISIDTTLQNYTQVAMNAYFYTGGAHPNSALRQLVVSEETNEIMSWKSIVKNEEKFHQLAEKYFRKAMGLRATESLKDLYWFENGIFRCNENFSISPNGMTFIFNAYEVAPYAVGVIEFTIPMQELKKELTIDLRFSK